MPTYLSHRERTRLELELGRRVVRHLLAESGQEPPPQGDDAATWIALLACRAHGIRPNRPCAAVVRAALTAAGWGQAVAKVNTGRRYCTVRLDWDSHADTDAVVAVLRPLWHDGRSRVRKVIDGAVYIDVPGWWHTYPMPTGHTGKEATP